MLDLRYVLDHLDEVRAALLRRGPALAAPLDRITELGSERKRAILELEKVQRERNSASEAMAKIADKKSAEFAEKREAARALGDQMKGLEARQKDAQAEVEEVLLSLPNLPYEQVPDGKSEADNLLVRTWGDKPALAFAAKDHVDVAERLGILDSARAVKIAGARFALLMGAGSQLERALMMFMLDLHTREHGYTEVWPPAIVNSNALRGTGQLPKFKEDQFEVRFHIAAPPDKANDAAAAQTSARGEFYLSPTAEVQLTNLHQDEVLEPGRLPIRYT
ncbi:MAG TPA: serine--tRNA ligase, partial [Polyangiales bacterium]